MSDPIEFKEFLDYLSERFGNLFFQKSIALRTGIADYRVKHLLGHEHPIKVLEWDTTRERYALDDLDSRLLSCISTERLANVSEIARRVGTPYSTVEGRIRKLQERKILVGYRYLLNNHALGIRSFLLLVYVKGLPPELKPDFRTFCLEHPHIRYHVECMGGWDYELGVEARDSQRVTVVAQELQAAFREYVSLVKILPVFAYRKVSTYPFRAVV